MNGERPIRWEWREGYNYAMKKNKAEIDRLRAENKMSDLGPKLIESLKQAIAGALARVTIEGVTWVRKDELDRLRTELEQCRDRLHLYADAPRQRRNKLTCQHEPSAVDPECPYCLRIEIDRLQTENAQNDRTIAAMEDVQRKLDAENNRLRAENAELRGALKVDAAGADQAMNSADPCGR